MADLHWYYRDTKDGSMTWLGGGSLAEGVTITEAVQIVSNVTKDLPVGAADYHDRLAQLRVGEIRPNHWRSGGKSGPIPPPDLITPVRVIFAADVRDRHLTGRAV